MTKHAAENCNNNPIRRHRRYNSLYRKSISASDSLVCKQSEIATVVTKLPGNNYRQTTVCEIHNVVPVIKPPAKKRIPQVKVKLPATHSGETTKLVTHETELTETSNPSRYSSGPSTRPDTPISVSSPQTVSKGPDSSQLEHSRVKPLPKTSVVVESSYTTGSQKDDSPPYGIHDLHGDNFDHYYGQNNIHNFIPHGQYSVDYSLETMANPMYLVPSPGAYYDPSFIPAPLQAPDNSMALPYSQMMAPVGPLMVYPGLMMPVWRADHQFTGQTSSVGMPYLPNPMPSDGIGYYYSH
jgi:hypothetical protein